MNNPISFASAASVAVQTPVSPVSGTYAMPPVDANNADLAITADANTTAYIQFGSNLPVGPDVPGCIVVRPGGTGLVTGNAALLAARLAKPTAERVPPGGTFASTNAQGVTSASGSFPVAWMQNQAQAAAIASQCSLITVPAGGVVTITRGTATPTTTF